MKITSIMTITKSSVLVLLFALYTVSFLPQIQSRVFLPMDANNFIEQTCKQTAYYDLCTSILRSDPRSSDADVKGLTFIVVGVWETKAKETLSHIEELIKGSPKQDEKAALSSCANNYNAIITTDIPKAIGGLDANDFKATEVSAEDACRKADSCAENFSGSSPLSEMNKLVHDTAALTATMALIMLNSPFLS